VWILAEASSIQSRKVKYRIDGHRDLSEGRPAEAVQKYRALIELDPSDRSAYAPLGEALIASGQFREAVKALEIALPSSLRGETSLVPDTLAYAYVVLGDEGNARRILRLSGPERDVESRLSRLKAAAAKSGRK
jgi:Flp pilus assembly protein TadD